MWESSFNYVLHNLNMLVKSPLSRLLSLLDICYFRQRVFKKGKSTERSSSANCYMPPNMQYINHSRNLGFSLRLLDPCKDHKVRGDEKLKFKTDFDSVIFDSTVSASQERAEAQFSHSLPASWAGVWYNSSALQRAVILVNKYVTLSKVGWETQQLWTLLE